MEHAIPIALVARTHWIGILRSLPARTVDRTGGVRRKPLRLASLDPFPNMVRHRGRDEDEDREGAPGVADVFTLKFGFPLGSTDTVERCMRVISNSKVQSEAPAAPFP